MELLLRKVIIIKLSNDIVKVKSVDILSSTLFTSKLDIILEHVCLIKCNHEFKTVKF